MGSALRGWTGAPVQQRSLPTRRRRAPIAAVAESGTPPSTRLFVARKFGVDVDEAGAAGRRLRDYVRLPADRYNVLDSKAVTRISDTTFRVSTGVQRLVMFDAEPVGFIDIKILRDGCEQRLTRAELVSVKPNRVVDEINATLSNLQLTNTVTAEDSSDGGKQLVCQLMLDGTFTRGVLSKVPEARLNGLMSWALGVAMPWFLTKLRDDYANWAQDRPRNASLGSGEMAALAKRLAAGGASMPPGVRELPVDAAWTDAAVEPSAPTEDEAGAPGGADVKPAASSTRGKGFGSSKPK